MRTELEILHEAFNLHQAGKLDEAEVIYDRLLGYVDQPDPNVYTSLGMLYAQRQQYGQAVHFLRMGLIGLPEHPGAWTNLGICLRYLGRREEAIKCQEKACEITPDDAIAWTNHGAMYVNQDESAKVVELSARALGLDGNYPEAHNNMAVGLLELGRFKEAWPHYEWRWETKERAPMKRPYKAPKWDGSPVDILAIHGEQGIGDEIMFMSLFHQAKQRANHIVVECMPRLIPWFERSFGVPCYPDHAALIQAQGEPEAYISMGSLPRLFGMPSGAPFLHRRHQSIPRRIGIAWKGGTDKTNKHERSMKLEALRPVLAQKGIEFVSVQYNGDDEAKAAGLLQNFKGNDFEKINDEIAKCDLIITVCQSAVHQAGSMGVPTWCMVPKRCAWRYSGQRMPWYNSVEFYRQGADEKWEPVIERIAADLERHYAEPEGAEVMYA